MALHIIAFSLTHFPGTMEQNKLHIQCIWLNASPGHQLHTYTGLLHLTCTCRMNPSDVIPHCLALWHIAAWVLATEVKKCFATDFREHWSSTLMNISSAVTAEQTHHQKMRSKSICDSEANCSSRPEFPHIS